MFKKETEYALRGLVYIQLQNLKGKRPGIAEIANEIETPPSFTAKVLQRLVRQGLVESQKGKNGGFFFSPDKPDLTLKTIISSIEGNTIFESCGFGLKNCDDKDPCPLHEAYAPIRDAINALVSDETIQSLASKNKSGIVFSLNRSGKSMV